MGKIILSNLSASLRSAPPLLGEANMRWFSAEKGSKVRLWASSYALFSAEKGSPSRGAGLLQARLRGYLFSVSDAANQ